MMQRVLPICGLLMAGVSAAEPAYTPTPAGWVLSHCVHEIEEGSSVRELEDGSTLVSSISGSKKIIAKCVSDKGLPVLKQHREKAAEAGRPLPPDYDGWLQYTAVNASKVGLPAGGGFDAFTNVMSVPDVPKARADQLFLFPGLQNIDWIPKVDPLPTSANPFDIIQPVLQYPGGGLFGGKWQVKSWYVTVNAGALYSSGIDVDAGDEILCNMTRTGPEDWVIVATSTKDPKKSTTQKASNPRLKLQPWAYNTLECYGCQGCDTYPTKAITFNDNKLYSGGKLVDVPGSQWAINPKPAQDLKCKEHTSVDAKSGDTTIFFQ